MRQVLIISVVLAGLAASVQPGVAGPFCLATDLYDGGDDCRYNTWAECRRSQPGVGLYCYTNTAAGYVFDLRDPANPRVIIPKPLPRPGRHRY